MAVWRERVPSIQKASWWRGSGMLWVMFCWENLGPAIHVEVTLQSIPQWAVAVLEAMGAVFISKTTDIACVLAPS